jgi:hypothetical protein
VRTRYWWVENGRRSWQANSLPEERRIVMCSV